MPKHNIIVRRGASGLTVTTADGTVSDLSDMPKEHIHTLSNALAAEVGITGEPAKAWRRKPMKHFNKHKNGRRKPDKKGANGKRQAESHHPEGSGPVHHAGA
ncbi:hypothetical protein [Acetobacter sp. UBA5411]|uniref:hypothetical protein n=1 Tax=Acetobacter sp. UBA5411 TaxID=1945905 RepID=UPI0025BFE9D6|nr:hypothetical protein [Acetobacter sp. UBA5411]